MLAALFAGLFDPNTGSPSFQPQKILDTLPDVVYIYDLKEQRVVYTNRSFGEMLGYSPKETQAMSLQPAEDLIYPDDRALLKEHFRQLSAAADGEILEFEYRLRDSSGDWCWVYNREQVFSRDEDGSIRYILSVAENITYRKAVEEALEENLAVYLTLFENNNDAIFVVGTDGRIVTCNPNSAVMLGYELEGLFGQPLSQMVAPAERGQSDQALARLTHGEAVPVYEQTLLKGDGSPLPVEINAAMVYGPQGNQLHIQYLVRDISQRKQAAAKLAAERNLLRTLIDHSPDYIFIKDREGRFIISNPAHTRASHATSEHQLIGKTAFEYFPPELAAQFHADDLNVMQSDEPLLNLERETVNSEGSKKWVLTTKVPLHNESGEVIGLMGMSRDITQRRLAEEALAEERSLLRTLIDNLPNPIYLKDTASRFVIANQRTAGLMGVATPDDLIGKTDFEFYPHDMAAQFYADEQAAMQRGQPLINSEERVLDHQTGEVRWLLTSIIPWLDQQGKIKGMIGIGLDITERKLAEETLAEERSLLRALIDNIPDPIYVKDTESRFTVANQALADLMGGATADDMIGKSDYDFYPREMAAGFRADEQAVMHGQALLHHEEVVVNHRTGRLGWLISTKVPWLDRQGNIKGMMGIGVDITERREMQQALQESEARFRALVTHAPVGIFQSTPDGNTRYVNARWCEIAGLSAEEGQGIGWIRILHPDDANRVATEWYHVVDRGGEFGMEYRCRRPDGTVVWVQTNAVPLRDESGVIIEYLGTAIDITERKLAEAALARERTLLRTLIDNLPHYIYVKDAQTRKLMANKADVLMTGAASEEEIIGKTDFDFYPKELAAQFYADDMQVITTGQAIVNREETNRDRNGREIRVLTSKLPLLDDHGQVIGLVGIGMDITERKQAEKQAMELAVEKERLKVLTDYMTNAAHDLRTPLSIINTSLYLYQQNPDAQKREKRITTIQEQAARLEKLIEGLALMSRIESASDFTLGRVDLNQMIEHTTPMFERKLADKELHFTLELSSNMADVAGDEFYLATAVERLMENAIQFTPPGGAVSVRTYLRAKEAVVEVSDTGIGVPAADLPYIFDHFYKVNKARTSDESGGGLGLSIAQKIVQRHHGRIEVESEPGKGSTFRLVLPSAL